ncbi:Hypothetical predicted protein, partial [Pelobates cultripes]
IFTLSRVEGPSQTTSELGWGLNYTLTIEGRTSTENGTGGGGAACRASSPCPIGHTRSAGGGGRSEAATWRKRSGFRVLVLAREYPGSRKKHMGPSEMNSAVPDLGGVEEANALVSLLKTPSGTPIACKKNK